MDAELHYRDFFEPPSQVKPPKPAKASKPIERPTPSKGKVRFHEEVRVKTIKAKGKNLPVASMFYEDEDEDEEDEEEEEGEGLSFDIDEDMEDEDAMLSEARGRN